MRGRRWQRLVVAGQGSRQPLAGVAVWCLMVVGGLGLLAGLYGRLEEYRPYLDLTVKRVMVLVAVAILLGHLVASALQAVTGTGRTALLYARRDSQQGSVVLASPLGCLGVPRRRITLTADEDVVITVVARPPKPPLYSYGPTSLDVRQGARTLRVTTVVRLSVGGKARTLQLLQEAGLPVSVVGDVIDFH